MKQQNTLENKFELDKTYYMLSDKNIHTSKNIVRISRKLIIYIKKYHLSICLKILSRVVVLLASVLNYFEDV